MDTVVEAERDQETRSWIVRGSGVAFAVLFVVGMMSAGAATDTENKSAAEVLKTFHDEKTAAVVSAYLLVLAGLAFLPLAWAMIRRVSAGLSTLAAAVARSTVVLFVAMLFSASILFASLAAAVSFGGEKDPSVELIRFIPQIGFGMLLLAGALTIALFLAIVSRAGQRSAALPTWFCGLGYLATVAMLFGVVFIPMLLLPIWAIGAAIVLA